MKKYIFIVIGFLFLIFQSCRKDDFNTSSSAKLSFSTDTVMFDTVFSSIGSITRSFQIYNRNKGTLKIESVNLAKGSASNYRINLNGTPGGILQEAELPEGDSMFVFVEVTVDPDRDEMIEEDAVEFFTNGNMQKVQLVAFGQDVHLINDSVVGNQTWGNDKPYLIYNSMLVDENKTLKLTAGARLHFHRNSQFIVLGTINSEGTAEEPVIIQGDRLEDMYFDVPGQWEGIWLTKISKNNSFNYTHILNANYGIWTDSIQNENPKVLLQNCVIAHHSVFGLYGVMSNIEAFNCEISDCGYNNVALTRGGRYNFYNCTIGNYFAHAVRRDAAVVLNNYLVADGTAYISVLENAYFSNCIIWGNKDTELNIDLYSEGVDNRYLFENCILKIDNESEIDISDALHYKSNLLNIDPKFKDYSEYDFSLDTLSQAKDAANPELINLYPGFLNFDINGNSRFDDAGPDIGAYERLETEERK